jgi:mannose/fructose/N-acetylgalactosamine-specific phosphotransferase system component IID
MDARVRTKMFGRSFLMQALWSPAGMQNLGLLYGLEPQLRRLYPSERDRREAQMRHLSYFNTNPYLSGFVLGLVARLEESPNDSRIETLKKATGAALGAVGDASVWGALQPACAALAACFSAFAWLRGWTGAAFVCAGLYLAAFNIPTLWMRWRGLGLGYEHGESFPVAMQEWRWRDKARWLRRAGILLAVAGPAALIVREAGFTGAQALFPAAAIVSFVWLGIRGFSGAALYGLVLAAALGYRAVAAVL